MAGIVTLPQTSNSAKRPNRLLVKPRKDPSSATTIRTNSTMNLASLVGGLAVRDQVDVEPWRDTAIEMIKKPQKFRVAMTRFAQRDHLAIESVEGGEQAPVFQKMSKR